MARYKYNLIKEGGIQEPWSGGFKNKKLALQWFEKHGEFHKARGHNLKLVKITSNEITE